MKKLFLLIPFLTGCSLLSPVPQTTMAVKINGTKFEWKCPKQFVGTNIVAEVSTNGTARFTVGSVSSINDPAVIDKAYAGQAAVAKEFFTGTTALLEKAAALKP